MEEAFRGFINGALLAIDRDRSLLLAFAQAAFPEAEVHAALLRLIQKRAGAAVPDPFVVDILLMALRALLADASLPSGRSISRSSLNSHLSGLVAQSIAL